MNPRWRCQRDKVCTFSATSISAAVDGRETLSLLSRWDGKLQHKYFISSSSPDHPLANWEIPTAQGGGKWKSGNFIGRDQRRRLLDLQFISRGRRGLNSIHPCPLVCSGTRRGRSSFSGQKRCSFVRPSEVIVIEDTFLNLSMFVG